MRSDMHGVVVDPGVEFADAPERFVQLVRPSEDQIIRQVLSQEPPNLLVLDEAHKWLGRWDVHDKSPLVGFLDRARNIGLSFVAATKRITRLPGDVIDLHSHLMINPPRSAAASRWLSQAGIDWDPEHRLRPGTWLWVPIDGEAELVTDEEALAKSLDRLQQTMLV